MARRTTCSARLDDVVAVYGRGDGLPARAAADPARLHGRPRPPARFRAVATLDDEDTLLGFGYGYRPAPGQWWHDQVRGALRRDARKYWLADCFEVVELHVRPAAQGHGLGARQLRALLAWPTADRAAVHPGGAEQTSRAWRLYRRFGFVDVLRHFIFPGDDRPFAVLGRELPLASPARTRPASSVSAGSGSARRAGRWRRSPTRSPTAASGPG